MTFDFKEESGRLKYLSEKMDDLLDGINDTYGKQLMDELISRMEKTVEDFNEEVQMLTDQLKENTVKKNELLKNIKNAKAEDITPEEVGSGNDDSEMSAWERRLESLSK